MLNHFMWFKLHNDQHDKLYTKHGTIWKKERFEMLPRLKNSWAIVVIWTPMLETNVLCSWYWWMIGEVQLSKAWKHSNRISPLLELGKSVHVNAVTVKIQGPKQLPEWWQSEEQLSRGRVLWGFEQKFPKCKMRVFERNGLFLS